MRHRASEYVRYHIGCAASWPFYRLYLAGEMCRLISNRIMWWGSHDRSAAAPAVPGATT